jgi:hypothetical protein
VALAAFVVLLLICGGLKRSTRVQEAREAASSAFKSFVFWVVILFIAAAVLTGGKH